MIESLRLTDKKQFATATLPQNPLTVTEYEKFPTFEGLPEMIPFEELKVTPALKKKKNEKKNHKILFQPLTIPPVKAKDLVGHKLLVVIAVDN